jgi:hypothetical protein
MVIALSFVGVIFIGIFAEALVPQMNANEGACLFDRSTECSETISEHTLEWLQTFDVATANSLFALVTLLGFLATILAVAIPTNVKANLLELYQGKILLRLGRDKLDKLSDYLLQAFSDGILNPKLF